MQLSVGYEKRRAKMWLFFDSFKLWRAYKKILKIGDTTTEAEFIIQITNEEVETSLWVGEREGSFEVYAIAFARINKVVVTGSNIIGRYKENNKERQLKNEYGEKLSTIFENLAKIQNKHKKNNQKKSR